MHLNAKAVVEVEANAIHDLNHGRDSDGAAHTLNRQCRVSKRRVVDKLNCECMRRLLNSSWRRSAKKASNTKAEDTNEAEETRKRKTVRNEGRK